MVLPSNLPSFSEFTNSGGNENRILDISMSNYYTKMLYDTHNLKDVSQNSINLERHSEVNMYYLLKYNKQIYLLQIIVFTCCIALVGAVLYSKSILSSNTYTYYLGVVFGVGFIIAAYNLYDIYIRDTITFNEYDFQYKPPAPDGSDLAGLTTSELANMEQAC
jgi:uncharacterized membrane protein (DUF485 family)